MNQINRRDGMQARSTTSKRHDGTFVAVDDNGNEYVIHIYTTVITTGESSKDGTKSYITDSDINVNRIEQGLYQLLESGVIVRSNDPVAP
jgi:hypothetical protein